MGESNIIFIDEDSLTVEEIKNIFLDDEELYGEGVSEDEDEGI